MGADDFRITYVSYEDLKAFDLSGTTETGDDDLLAQFVIDASREFERQCRGRLFYPRYEAQDYDHPEDSGVLILRDELLEVDTLTTDNGDTTIAAADQFLMCGNNRNVMPYDRIELNEDGTTTYFEYSDTWQKANRVTGWWGYHEQWADAWQDANDNLAAAIGSTTATTFTVADIDGADLYGNTPRFKVGDLLKIDDEYFLLTAKNTTTNTATVRRGMAGTTAATHADDSDIYVYKPMPDVYRAVRRMALWMYRLKEGDITAGTTAFPDLGMLIETGDAPKDILQAIKRYKRRSYR